MRLPISAHTSRPWRIHELTRDFDVADVWALSTPGGPDEFPQLVSQLATDDFPNGGPLIVRALWEARWKVGALLGWDRADTSVGDRVSSLRARLPGDLRDAPPGPEMLPLTSVYLLADEWAAELTNRTVHAVMHIGWVPADTGGYRGQLAVLVKPNGLLGRLYMAAIKPFRHLIVYPVLTRRWERLWRDRDVQPQCGAGTTASPVRRRTSLIRWAGRLIVFYGAAHTLGALTVEGAGRHAGAWLRGELWADDLATMSPANSAYWLSVMSFGPPLVLVGLTVLWVDDRGLTPPSFIAWTLGVWPVADTVFAGPRAGQGLILLLAVGLLLGGASRAATRGTPAPFAAMRHPSQRTAAHRGVLDNLPSWPQ